MESATTFEDTKERFKRIEAELNQAQANFDQVELQYIAAKNARDLAAERHRRSKEEFMERQLCRPGRWNDNYRKLLKWKEEHDGDTMVTCTKDSPEDVKKLNTWVLRNRCYYRYYNNGDKRHIKEYQIYGLTKIGFVWDVSEHLWNQNMELLLKYYTEFGDFQVPKEEHGKLWRFIAKVRTAYRRKQDGQVQQELNEDRIAQLNKLNFEWVGKHPSGRNKTKPTSDSVRYEPMVKVLAEFKEEHGHLKVHSLANDWKRKKAKPSKAEYRALPKFVSFLRNQHDLWREGKPSSLDDEKVRDLTELGLEWKKPGKCYVLTHRVLEILSRQYL